MSIKVVTEPSIYVVGRQTVDDAELSRFLADEGVSGWSTDTEVGGEKLAEVAGRLCYLSFAKPRPGGNKTYLGHILEVGHGSVLEHEVFNLIVTGVSRSFTHELIRHRAGVSPSQLSQRYVDESDVAFVVPPAIPVDPNHRIFRVWHRACEDARDYYRAICVDLHSVVGNGDRSTSSRKAAREAARSVLPNCTETKVFLTANARALRNIMEQRGSEHADAEMRRFAMKLHEVLARESPNVFGDYEVRSGDNGPHLYTDHRKV